MAALLAAGDEEDEALHSGCFGNESGTESACCGTTGKYGPVAPMQWSLLLVGWSYVLTALVGAFLNTLALAGLARNRALRGRPATCFTMNLAAADLLYCIVALPVDAATYLTQYDWDTSVWARSLCSFSALCKYTGAFMDWSSLALIAIERYFKIVLGSDSHKAVFSTRNVAMILVGNWAMHWCILGIFAEYGYNHWTHRCDMLPAQNWFHFLDRGIAHMAWMALVVGVILVTCLKIWLYVHNTTSALLDFNINRYTIETTSVATNTTSSTSNRASLAQQDTSSSREAAMMNARLFERGAMEMRRPPAAAIRPPLMHTAFFKRELAL
ncbi:unnamed protein product, partial [Notodromas monacha]